VCLTGWICCFFGPDDEEVRGGQRGLAGRHPAPTRDLPGLGTVVAFDDLPEGAVGFAELLADGGPVALTWRAQASQSPSQ
jgi:hypothetical protein